MKLAQKYIVNQLLSCGPNCKKKVRIMVKESAQSYIVSQFLCEQWCHNKVEPMSGKKTMVGGGSKTNLFIKAYIIILLTNELSFI